MANRQTDVDWRFRTKLRPKLALWVIGWLVRSLVASFFRWFGLDYFFHVIWKADSSHNEVMIRCVQE